MKGTGEQQKYLERRLVEERHFRVEGDLYSTFLKGKRRELRIRRRIGRRIRGKKRL